MRWLAIHPVSCCGVANSTGSYKAAFRNKNHPEENSKTSYLIVPRIPPGRALSRLGQWSCLTIFSKLRLVVFTRPGDDFWGPGIRAFDFWGYAHPGRGWRGGKQKLSKSWHAMGRWSNEGNKYNVKPTKAERKQPASNQNNNEKGGKPGHKRSKRRKRG